MRNGTQFLKKVLENVSCVHHTQKCVAARNRDSSLAGYVDWHFCSTAFGVPRPRKVLVVSREATVAWVLGLLSFRVLSSLAARIKNTENTAPPQKKNKNKPHHDYVTSEHLPRYFDVKESISAVTVGTTLLGLGQMLPSLADAS